MVRETSVAPAAESFPAMRCFGVLLVGEQERARVRSLTEKTRYHCNHQATYTHTSVINREVTGKSPDGEAFSRTWFKGEQKTSAAARCKKRAASVAPLPAGKSISQHIHWVNREENLDGQTSRYLCIHLCGFV